MSDQVVLGQIVLPPSDEHCSTALCAQKACCDVLVRVAGDELADGDEEEAYVLPQCPAHALYTLTGVLEYAKGLFPPDEPEDVPWETPSE